jgi:multidrug resistance efflux pump
MLDPSLINDSVLGNHQAVVHPLASAQAEETRSAESRADLAESTCRALATALELQSSLDASTRLADAAFQAAQRLRRLFRAKRVTVFWQPAHIQMQLAILADSDQQQLSPANLENRMALAAATEIEARSETVEWLAKPHATGRPIGLLAVEQLAKHWQASCLLGTCLVNASGQVRGVVLVLAPESEQSHKQLEAFAPALTSKLESLERLQLRPHESMLRNVFELSALTKRSILALVALAIAILALVPARYQVFADIELQPKERRFVAAPFDGLLEVCLVQPGDIVAENQVLARMDPHELDFEFASVQADLKRVLLEKKGRMAEHEAGASQIAALEIERLQNQADLLAYRRNHVEIRSPISGVIVSGDWRESMGIPLTRGESLFEIAPAGQMTVEIAVPESDVIHVRQGQFVHFSTYAQSGKRLVGVIARVNPSAELREHRNVFIAEVDIEDSEGLLRPGMRGRATIVSDVHSLGWNLFHKPWHALRQWIGV